MFTGTPEHLEAAVQFLVSVIDSETGSGTDDELSAITAFNQRLRANGHWVFAGGLASPQSSTLIDNRDGAGLTTDGPLVESNEYLSGFWILTAPDLGTARVLAAEASQCCNRRVELRPLLG